MRLENARKLIRFNARMGMWVCPSTRSNVVSFLHGYEYGTANECRFTELLSEHLAERYEVKKDSLGWPHQIQRLAEQNSLDWMGIYLVVSAEILRKCLERYIDPYRGDSESDAEADPPSSAESDTAEL